MTLQLQDSSYMDEDEMNEDGMDLAFSFRRAFNPVRRLIPKQAFQAARYGFSKIPNRRLRSYITSSSPYQQILNDSINTPTYQQFLYDEGLTGLEDEGELASRFGSWVRKTASKAGQGISKLQKFASPFISMLPGGQIVNSAFDIINRPKDNPMEPAPMPQPVVTPMLPAAMPPMMPAPYEMPMAPQYAGNPYAGFEPAPAPGSVNILGKDISLTTLALLALGGFIAYKQLKK